MHAEKRINMGNRIAQNVIIKSVKKFWNEEDGMGVVEIVLITVGILTPYYGVSIKCIT